MKTKVLWKMSLPISFKKEDKYYTVCCPVFDVWSQGETMSRAKENIIEALQMFLMDCYERGTLDQVLRESGFVPLTEKRPGSIKKIQGEEQVSIPLPFIVDRSRLCPI